jgi:high affinity sulfate transporter 1
MTNPLTAQSQSTQARLWHFFPILRWLPAYQSQWFRADLYAGLTLWGMLVPEAIAYAGMAGAPPQAGLYTLLASLAAYVVLGTSRQLVCAATSSSSIMMAAVVAPLALAAPHKYGVLLVALVLLVGLFFLVCGLLRLGFVASFMSKPVMTGFVCGLAIYIAVSQAGKILGLPRGPGDTLQQAWHLLTHLQQGNWATCAVGLGALALLFGLERVAPRVPAALLVMILGIAAASFCGLAGRCGVQVVGLIPGGLPGMSLPSVSAAELLALLPGALGVTLVTFSQALGTSQAFAARHGYEIDTNQELVAMGVANLGSGLLGGLVNGGSMSSTAVNDRAGAQTQVSQIVASGMALVTVLALMPLFHNLPEAVLGAVVIHAVARLLKVGELWRFYRWQRGEFWLALVALLGVLAIDILPGLLLAVLLSLWRLIWRASHLSISLLGQVPGQMAVYGNLRHHPEYRPIEGLAILRPAGPLFFANAQQLRDEVQALLHHQPPPAAILLDLHANPSLDLTTLDILWGLLAEARQAGVELLFAELAAPVRDLFSRSGLLAAVGEARFFRTLDEAVQDYLGRHGPAAEVIDKY